MITLMEFLTAMIDRDEAVALAATPGPWRVRQLGRHDDAAVVPAGTAPQSNVGIHGHHAVADAGHIARHDPARVLAGVDAARARLRLYDAVEMADPTTAATLRKVEALPYADHDDYRKEWAPQPNG